MMNTKKIMFIVMCVLLTVVIILTVIVINRGVSLVQSIMNPGTSPGDTTISTQPSTDPQVPTTPPTSQPTVPPATEPSATQPTGTEHVHDWVLTESKEATCENYGYNIYTCSTCGKQNIPFEEQTEPTGHSFGPGRTVAPTCTEKGWTEYICSVCGFTDKRNYKDPLGHDFVLTEPVAAGCENEGYDLYACSRCDLKEQRNTTAALGHNYELIGEPPEPSCTEDVTAQYQCSHCGGVIEETVPAAGHSFVQIDQGSSCTENWVLYQCSVCGEEKTETLEAPGHNFHAWSENADGSIERYCTVCDLLQTSADLTITGEYTDTANSNEPTYLITVGVQDEKELFSFTVCDKLNNGSLEYHLDPCRGLVVTYTDSTGEPKEIVQPYLATDPVVIPAE